MLTTTIICFKILPKEITPKNSGNTIKAPKKMIVNKMLKVNLKGETSNLLFSLFLLLDKVNSKRIALSPVDIKHKVEYASSGMTPIFIPAQIVIIPIIIANIPNTKSVLYKSYFPFAEK